MATPQRPQQVSDRVRYSDRQAAGLLNWPYQCQSSSRQRHLADGASDTKLTSESDMNLDQPATLIDLDGTAPLVSSLHECARHFRALTAKAKADARILLTVPLPRAGRRTRTWLLNPDEIERLADQMAVDSGDR